MCKRLEKSDTNVTGVNTRQKVTLGGFKEPGDWEALGKGCEWWSCLSKKAQQAERPFEETCLYEQKRLLDPGGKEDPSSLRECRENIRFLSWKKLPHTCVQGAAHPTFSLHPLKGEVQEKPVLGPRRWGVERELGLSPRGRVLSRNTAT